MNKFYRNYGKRIFDLFLSFFAVIFLWPIFIIVAILVKMKLGSPVIFMQKRPGKDENIFTMYKFRTMTNQRDSFGNLLPDAERLTRFGRFLRSTSLDELPEIWNVIKGDMSWVGPRPLLVEYLGKYNEQQKMRHNVKPGLTGLAQVSGRNSLTWTKKFDFDLQYVGSVSLITDIGIILMTIKTILFRKGITSDNHVTMPIFDGEDEGISCKE